MKTRRTGAALAMVLVAGAVASLLMAAQAASMIARQRFLRQAGLKTQAQWLAESALDRARLQRPEAGQPAETWQPDVSDSALPPQHASFRLETSDAGVATIVVAGRVGRDESPHAAQHVLRQTITTGEESP